MALSQGGDTTKLKYGHRGVNQPVKNLETGRTYISSQNHGYAVVNEEIEKVGAKVSYINANDARAKVLIIPIKKPFRCNFTPKLAQVRTTQDLYSTNLLK